MTVANTDCQVPWLRSGTGSVPSEGGCIMQVIDWIDRNEWTDSPPCVHPVIQKLAIHVNDRLDDEGRQNLLDLAPRMMNTASEDKVLSVRLATFCARRVLAIFEEEYPDDKRLAEAIAAAERWCDDPSEENRQSANAAANAAAYAAAYAANAAANAAAYAAAYAAYAANAAYAAAAYAYAAAAANAAYAAANAAGNAAWQLLLDTLDEYERLTDHSPATVDWAPAIEAMAGAH